MNEASQPDEHFGVYIHIPFCAHRCDYCAFATWTGKEHLVDAYIDACLTEITTAQRSGMLRRATTVFIGGGTPSLIGPAPLRRLIGALEVSGDVEITVECNPESTTPELLDGLHQAGVNRLSLGVQSLRAHVLEGLGRRAGPDEARRAVRAIGEAGFSNFNVDLIFGGFGETAADWAMTLQEVLALDPMPPHLSAYALTVEAGTPLSRDVSRHPNDDVCADRYAYCDEVLSAAAYGWYEVSNWSKPGHECRHNFDCWEGRDYLGIGCAAHSHLDGTRFSNVRILERYVDAISNGQSAVASTETLGGEDRALEELQLLLRTRRVPGWALPEDEALSGLIERRGERAVLSVGGRLLLNEVALRLRPSPQGGSTATKPPVPTLRGLDKAMMA